MIYIEKTDKVVLPKEFHSRHNMCVILYDQLVDLLRLPRYKTLMLTNVKLGKEAREHNTQPLSQCLLCSLTFQLGESVDKLQSTKSKNKEILQTLIRHIFEYKIITRIKDEKDEDLQVYFCDACKCNHGLPDDLRNLIRNVKQKVAV